MYQKLIAGQIRTAYPTAERAILKLDPATCIFYGEVLLPGDTTPKPLKETKVNRVLVALFTQGAKDAAGIHEVSAVFVEIHYGNSTFDITAQGTDIDGAVVSHQETSTF